MKKYLYQVLILSILLLSQSCALVEVAIRIPFELATSDIQTRDEESSFFGKPYIGFRTDLELMIGVDVFDDVKHRRLTDNPLAIILLPADLLFGTLFLPIDLSVQVYDAAFDLEPEEAELPKDKIIKAPKIKI